MRRFAGNVDQARGEVAFQEILRERATAPVVIAAELDGLVSYEGAGLLLEDLAGDEPASVPLDDAHDEDVVPRSAMGVARDRGFRLVGLAAGPSEADPLGS